MINRRHFVSTLLAASGGLSLHAQGVGTSAKPNVLYILCDDLGYGDVQILNPKHGKIKTPCIDALARNGMPFTDMHSSSSVCTPTRYSILTGRYSWRTKLQKSVLWGFDKPLIPKERKTVGHIFQQAGYETACIGKWHLGLEMTHRAANDPAPKTQVNKKIDYSKPIGMTPYHLGFDSYFGIAASLDMPPYVWIENDRFTEEPTTAKAFFRRGDATADFEAVDVHPILIEKAQTFMAKKRNKPFFLYLPLASPHTPIVPTKEWKGKSGISPYADFVMQVDHSIGQLVETLKASGQLENTLILFTSDNGCSPAAGIPQLNKHGHIPSAGFRGTKADIWEGGHRIPFIAHWPKKIKPNRSSDQLLCLSDLMATAADLTNQKLPANAGEDSFSFLPVLTGSSNKPIRQSLISHSIDGAFAIRTKEWKLAICPGSGGWSAPKDGQAKKKKLPAVQLYNMKTDWRETTNLQAEHPDIVKSLTTQLETIVKNGRSTPGTNQPNDVPIIIDKIYKKTKF